MVVRYNQEQSSNMHATASLRYTFPKKGICEPPDAYHQILYVAIAMKHGPEKTDMSFKDLCNQ